MRISANWTAEERLHVIHALAVTIEKDAYAYMARSTAFLIRLVASVPTEYLEREREVILRTAKLQD